MNDGNATEPDKADPLDDDPFFKLIHDNTWNACIGTQGTEENYLDGYIEAALELADALIEKSLFGKRDTIILPILYNARHAVELLLKFVLDRLHEAHVISHVPPRDHDIKRHWEFLSDAEVGDEELRYCVRRLGPYVESLSRVDDDGQELRYHLNRNQDPSLATYSLANIEVVRASLSNLSKVISSLKYRTMDFLDERTTGAVTKRFSRRDLLDIAKQLPPIASWNTPAFDESKARLKAKYQISGRQFSSALDTIKQNREMKAVLGAETPLLHLSDDTIVWIVEQWRKLHPPPPEGATGKVVTVTCNDFEEMFKHIQVEAEVVKTLDERLTEDELADLKTVFYIGRDRRFPEAYEKFFEGTKKKHAVDDDRRQAIGHVIGKANLLMEIRRATLRLGRLSLAARLEGTL